MLIAITNTARSGIAVIGLVLLGGLAYWILRPQPLVDRGPFLTGAHIDGRTQAILERSCADCHSDAPRYPWYSFLPVISGIIKEDIAKGRDQLNFSRWTDYPRLRQQRALTGIANQVKDRAMPLPSYLRLHPSARLSDADVDNVFAWAEKERLRLILEGAR